ncbi:hypothetical protein EAX61_09380 [Dokdonia sinensis]|uniref:Uncharacterized protein n=1 Tax=Dokdonia sinensis TaxID=2479847 RepID=A0A3M0G1R0_9FLAO|nr:hypothetical protein [Dokdonia sinensis]RMB58508.1 hypothetical protein EAX61_09380 [Dokdonia sinensis]
MKLLQRLKNLGKKGNTNLIVAGSALFISACALLISVQEMRIMRTQQKASMYPYLTVGMSYNSEGFGYILKNSGNGLAKIDSYKVANDTLYFRDWFDVLQTVMPEAQGIDYSIINTAGNIRRQMITPGEEVNLIFLKWTTETRILEKRVRDLKIVICYASLLDEHWMIEDGLPIDLDTSCTITMEEEFGF